MSSPHLLVREVSTLFSLPGAAVLINELIDDPRASFEDFAEVILNDTGLTARLLKLANSAYYGFSSKVATVTRAIALIGSHELRNLVLATSVVSVFRGIPSDIVDMETFWLHSVSCGTVARLLGRHCDVLYGERLFITGLLHAVGKLVFYSQRADQYRLVLEHRDQGEEAITAAERRIFGFDHAALGAELLKDWKLPDSQHAVVAHYLEPSTAKDYRLQTCVVHVASRLAHQITPNVNVEQQLDGKQPQIDKHAWTTLKLDDEQVEGIVQDARLQAFEMLQIINPKAQIVL